MEKRLSIIIPVYNGEAYLEKCLRSCMAQDLQPQEYEVIVVNDGSTDRTQSIIDRIAGEYAHLQCISKTNGGVSSARNAGLDVASGEVIWFVDADDWIEANCVVDLLEQLNANNLDVLQFNAHQVDIYGNITPYYLLHQSASPILSPEVYFRLGYFEGYAHMSIIRRAVIEENHTRFNASFKMREDLLFNMEVVSNVKRIQRVHRNPYYYCLRASSASSLYHLDPNIPLLNAIRNIKRQDVLKEYNEWLFPDYIYDHIDQHILHLHQLMEELKVNGYQHVKVSVNSKQKIKIFFAVYNLHFRLALYVFWLIKRIRFEYHRIFPRKHYQACA